MTVVAYDHRYLMIRPRIPNFLGAFADFRGHTGPWIEFHEEPQCHRLGVLHLMIGTEYGILWRYSQCNYVRKPSSYITRSPDNSQLLFKLSSRMSVAHFLQESCSHEANLRDNLRSVLRGGQAGHMIAIVVYFSGFSNCLVILPRNTTYLSVNEPLDRVKAQELKAQDHYTSFRDCCSCSSR